MKNKNTSNSATGGILGATLAIIGALVLGFGRDAVFTVIGIVLIGIGVLIAIGNFSSRGEGEKEHSYTIKSVTNVDRMEGHEFEYFCAELLERCGFEDVTVTRGSGDQGVDILAFKEDIKYAIQCKNYSFPLGNKPVQEVFAGKTFYKCHVGVVMTNSVFTKGAYELADSVGVILWDKHRLDKMMIETGMQEFVKTSK
jgi:restriction system protein